MFDQEKTLKSLKGVPVTRIFVAAFITQFCMGLEVLLRISAATPIKRAFFDAVDPLTSGAHIGEILGVLFLGFAIANFVMAPFIDAIGMRRVHVLGVFAFLAGTATICLAHPGAEYAYALLWGGSLLQGLAWGTLESVLNPLVVSIYPTRKVARLNLFHAAYALGMLVAAPICVLVGRYALGWKLQLCIVFFPAFVALILVSRLKYPLSERVIHGVSFREMFRHTLSRPLFYLCLCAMFLTAATELVPSNWIDLTLTKVVGIQGFWLVAFIYTVHLVVKSFAGVLNKHLGSAGLLMLASLFALAGLLMLSHASTPATGLFAALVFGIGTAVMWPTTMAATSERFPGGGSFAIGTMASAGMLSTYVMMPVFGRMFDAAKIDAAGGAAAFKALAVGTPAFDKTMVVAAATIFGDGSAMPMITLVFFALLWLYDSRRRHAGIVLAEPIATE
ncbi:MAG: MFS transporter [Paraburkholderia sp.]